MSSSGNVPRKAARMRISTRATAFWGLVLGYAAAAHACGYHAPDSISTLPGMGFYRPDLLLLYPILSGTLERPVYSLAGYKVSTLAFSIQANFIASIVIGVAAFFGYAMVYDLSALVFLFAAPVTAIAIKLWWFNRVPREEVRPRIGTFVLATLLSTITIATIPLWRALFGTNTYSYADKVREVRVVVILAVLGITIVTHSLLFAKFSRDAAVDTRRGFEVLPPDHVLPTAMPTATEVAA
jgi:hypothetical protein